MPFNPQLSSARPAGVHPFPTMITDTELYRLAIVLGSAAMVLIILYHFFEVNSGEEESSTSKPRKAAPQTTPASTKTK